MEKTKHTCVRLLGRILVFAVVLGLAACGRQMPAPHTTQPEETIQAELSLQPTPIGHDATAYPLVFLDTTEGNCQAYILGYVGLDGIIQETDVFSYNDRSLWDFLEEEETAVTSDILPAGTRLTFTGSTGAVFETTSGELLTESDMLNVMVHLLPQLDGAPDTADYYLGATKGILLQPAFVARQAQNFTADLNSDNKPDRVSWEFSEVAEDGEVFYYYHITAAVGDKIYTISADRDYYPCSQEGFAVFPVDIEGDGSFELAVLHKIYGMFREFAIYRLADQAATPIFTHTIDGMP